MIERDHLLPTAPRDAGFLPPGGDPSLELFGHGWSPYQESYQGRHRAEDA